MLIYSESFHVEHPIEKEWIEWMKETVIPAIYQTGKFTRSVFTKVISHTDETGNTYSIQYYIENKEKLEDFYVNDSPKINQLIFSKFGTRVLSFKTELELIDIFEF